MSRRRLLIVEDNADIAQMLQEYFARRGFEVWLALAGVQALETVRDRLPDLILMDIGLPDMNGFEVYRQIRQLGRLRHTPVIFLTQHGRKEDRLAGLELGADDFITKPFDLEELYLRVQNVVARSERQSLTDPRTGLSSSTIVQQELERVRGRDEWRAFDIHLRHAGEFRDLYGALASTDILRYTALLVNRVLNELGHADDFVGTPSEDTFTLICGADRATAIRRAISERFDADVTRHYAMGERRGERILVRDATGQERSPPAMGLEFIELEL